MRYLIIVLGLLTLSCEKEIYDPYAGCGSLYAYKTNDPKFVEVHFDGFFQRGPDTMSYEILTMCYCVAKDAVFRDECGNDRKIQVLE